MNKEKFSKSLMYAMLCCTLILSLGMIGCEGDTGPAGPAGVPGEPGEPGTGPTAAKPEYSMTIKSVSVSPGGQIIVNFDTDLLYSAATETPFDDITRVSVISLQTNTVDGQKTWFRKYSRQRMVKENLTDNGGGSYTYVVPAGTSTDPNLQGTVAAGDTKTHRVVIDWTGNLSRIAGAAAFDFVPVLDGSTLAAASAGASKRVVATDSCLKCHAYKQRTETGANWYYDSNHHLNERSNIELCNVCHNRYGTYTPSATSGAYATVVSQNTYSTTTNPTGFSNNNSPLGFNMHRRHSQVPRAGASATQQFAGGNFPQDVTNCRTCHNGDAGADNFTPEGDNWKTNPSRLACGGCHIDVDFQTGTGHSAGPQADDASCKLCHNANSIESYHVTDNATPNNPSVPAGAVNFEYIVSSVTVTSGTQPVVNFTIKKDGTPVTFEPYSAATNTTTLINGFTGGPSFLVAYADGTKSTVDHNNLGKSAAQPSSVSILTLWNGSAGTLEGPAADGSYTATITAATSGFPAGSKLRTIALQGYFTQAAGTGGIAANTARHTLSAVKEVNGETRRSIVDPAKCANCHEMFEGHGGNRNIGKNTTGTIVCVVCHNPNLSSSGTTVDLAYEEATQNLKDMIHSIHAAHERTTPYVHYRAKSGAATKYDWSHVGYPGDVAKCKTCHKPGTYDAELPAGVLMTTDRVGSAAATTAAVAALRNTVDNASDNVTTPVTSTCVGCHDSPMAKAHMTQNGGQISALRSNAIGVEVCTLCHGIGRSADVVEMHK